MFNAARGFGSALLRLATPRHLMALPLLPALTLAMHLVTVRPGDSLSKIAARDCGTARDWTGIYAANRGTIGSDPNLIDTGWHLRVSCRAVPSLAVLASPRQGSQPAAARPVFASRTSLDTSFSVSNGFQACVIARESGGNSQIWNGTGHYGLYQFSAGTWAAHGGNPADFGRASAAEQTQVFWNTVRADGTSDWAPYDGC